MSKRKQGTIGQKNYMQKTNRRTNKHNGKKKRKVTIGQTMIYRKVKTEQRELH